MGRLDIHRRLQCAIEYKVDNWDHCYSCDSKSIVEIDKKNWKKCCLRTVQVDLMLFGVLKVCLRTFFSVHVCVILGEFCYTNIVHVDLHTLSMLILSPAQNSPHPHSCYVGSYNLLAEQGVWTSLQMDNISQSLDHLTET